MIDIEELARKGFKIIDGRLCYKDGTMVAGLYRVNEFGWGSPCTEYHFDDYSLHEYTIEKAVQCDDWYLKKNGYQEICRLRHSGGKNWETF